MSTCAQVDVFLIGHRSTSSADARGVLSALRAHAAFTNLGAGLACVLMCVCAFAIGYGICIGAHRLLQGTAIERSLSNLMLVLASISLPWCKPMFVFTSIGSTSCKTNHTIHRRARARARVHVPSTRRVKRNRAHTHWQHTRGKVVLDQISDMEARCQSAPRIHVMARKPRPASCHRTYYVFHWHGHARARMS